jgi:hypothetical protein
MRLAMAFAEVEKCVIMLYYARDSGSQKLCLIHRAKVDNPGSCRVYIYQRLLRNFALLVESLMEIALPIKESETDALFNC